MKKNRISPVVLAFFVVCGIHTSSYGMEEGVSLEEVLNGLKSSVSMSGLNKIYNELLEKDFNEDEKTTLSNTYKENSVRIKDWMLSELKDGVQYYENELFSSVRRGKREKVIKRDLRDLSESKNPDVKNEAEALLKKWEVEEMRTVKKMFSK